MPHVVFKKCVLGLFLYTSLILSSGFSFAQEKVPHMVGLYLSQSGRNFIEYNMDQFFEMNGISTTSFYWEKFHKRMPNTPFNTLFEDNRKIIDAAKKIRYYFRKFFKGNMRIRNSHEFEFSIDGIEITGEWDKFGVKLIPTENADRNGIRAEAHLILKDFRLYVDKARFKDHKHPFLGELGPDKFVLTPKRNGKKFEIRVPITAKMNRRGGIDMRISNPITNLRDIVLEADWQHLEMPRVRIQINGRSAYLNLREVEREIKKQVPKILGGVVEKLQAFVNQEAVPMVNKKFDEWMKSGFTEVNEMAPLGIPDGQVDVNYIWGINIKKLNWLGNNFHFGLDGYVTDPKRKDEIEIPRSLLAKGLPQAQTFAGERYDLGLTLNQGFINRILQLSNERGYFRNLDAGGEKLQLVEQPKLNLNGKGKSGKPATLTVKTKYKVEGWQKAFVRNPIQIQMDLNIDFVTKSNGVTQMVIDSVDLDSVKVHRRYIRLFRRKVRKEVKKTLAGISKKIKGHVLAENLPIPSDIGGIPIKTNKIKIDSNGHLVILLKYDL